MDVPAQAQKTNSLSLCLFVLLRPLVDWMMPTHIENISIQTTNLNTNLTLVDTPRKMLYLLSGHPVTKSSLGIKLSITPAYCVRRNGARFDEFQSEKIYGNSGNRCFISSTFGVVTNKFLLNHDKGDKLLFKITMVWTPRGKGRFEMNWKIGIDTTHSTNKSNIRQMTDENLLYGSGNSAERSVAT